MATSSSKLQEVVKDKEAWPAAVHAVAKTQTRHDWATKQRQQQFISDELTASFAMFSWVFFVFFLFCLNESALYLNMLTLSCCIFAILSCKLFFQFVSYLLVLCGSYFKLTESVLFSSVQSLSRVWLFAIAARQASLSITNCRSSLRLTSIESVMHRNILNGHVYQYYFKTSPPYFCAFKKHKSFSTHTHITSNTIIIYFSF